MSAFKDKRPILLLTVDVEEDMPDWKIADPLTVANAQALPRLAALCRELGVQATYLCTYPMLTQPESKAVLEGIWAEGQCEIGTHMHPWNTPPFQGVPGYNGVDEQSLLYFQHELGPERFRAKLEVLHQAAKDITGKDPVSFRAGRFGIDNVTLRELVALGYEVDSSVTPLEEHTMHGGPDFRRAPLFAYRPHEKDLTKRGDLPIIEIPVSVEFTRPIPSLLRSAFVHLPRWTHLRGLLSSDFLGVIDFAWLYPARFVTDHMVKAAATIVESGNPVLNVFIHSSELMAGTSGRFDEDGGVEGCFVRMREILTHCLEKYDAQPLTLGGAARQLRSYLGM